MFEESIWWVSMNSWLTPTVLFVLLNVMIGTIAISSSLAKSQNNQQKKNSDQLDRSPSVLQKLKSVNIYNFRSQEAASYLLQNNPEPEQEQTTSFFRSPSVLHRLTSIGRHNSAAASPPETEPEPEPDQEQTSFFRSPSVLHRLTSIGRHNSAAASPPETEPEPEPDQEQTSFFSSPSVLQRLKSIGRNSSAASPPENEQPSFFRSPSVLQRLKSIGRYNAARTPDPEPEVNDVDANEEADELRSIDEIYSQLKSGGGGHVTRSNSDTAPNAGVQVKPVKLAKKMKKSASAKSAFAHFEEVETVEARRPATVREVRAPAKDQDDDEEVDSKADDFINKFKQQLKLQRLNSIIRYKEMIGGRVE